jgi:8-amino-7-oxononanoate synthase
MAVSRALLGQGFLVPAIRPPTVAPNASRLRVSLSAAHEDADVERFTAAFAASASVC